RNRRRRPECRDVRGIVRVDTIRRLHRAGCRIAGDEQVDDAGRGTAEQDGRQDLTDAVLLEPDRQVLFAVVLALDFELEVVVLVRADIDRLLIGALVDSRERADEPALYLESSS